MEVEYGTFFLSSYRQGPLAATGGSQAVALHGKQQQNAASTLESRPLPLPACRFFAGRPSSLALPQPPQLLTRSVSDTKNLHPCEEDAETLGNPCRRHMRMEPGVSSLATTAVIDWKSDSVQSFDTQHEAATPCLGKLPRCDSVPDTATPCVGKLLRYDSVAEAATPCAGKLPTCNSVPEAAIPCTGSLPRCNSVPEAATPSAGKLPRCALVTEDATPCADKLPRCDPVFEATIEDDALPATCALQGKVPTDQTETTVEGASPRTLDPPQGIICDELEIPALVDTASAKEQPVITFCMDEEPKSINEAACIAQPEPEQEVAASARSDSAKMDMDGPKEPSGKGYEVHGDANMVLDVSPHMPSETEQVNELVDMLEPEPDTDSLQAKVSASVDTFFEMHELACVATAMTCRRHSVWRLHPLGRFKVNAPEPHPGVQYRLTKRLHDRAGKTAHNGEEVEGSIEECGLWLLVEMPRNNGMTTYYYLPMRVGDHQLVQEIESPVPQHKTRKGKSVKTIPFNQTAFCLCKKPATSKEQFRVRERRRYNTTTRPLMTPQR